jgi:hypothetical protein
MSGEMKGGVEMLSTQFEIKRRKEMTIEFTKLVVDDEITLYGIHSIINAVFEKLEMTKRIPPQMMYNYAKNGRIRKNGNGMVSREDAIAFLESYLTKQLSKKSTTNHKSNVESAFVES